MKKYAGEWKDCRGSDPYAINNAGNLGPGVRMAAYDVSGVPVFGNWPGAGVDAYIESSAQITFTARVQPVQQKPVT